MDLSYSGQERIAAVPETVWAFMVDPANLGRCVPDAKDVKVLDDRRVDVGVGVKMGFFRGTFTLKFTLTPNEATRTLDLAATGSGMGSQLELGASAVLTAQDGGSVLDWTGDASMSGTIAALGSKAVDDQARGLIEQTFANVGRRVGGG